MTTTVAATFCATMVDEWARAGVRLACVSPGSRSTPMALALAADDRLQVAVFADERSTAFAAVGHGLATGSPAVALCTSGTAATHFHAAVVEAHLSSVPLLACTADRPPELWDVGAPQTIDQTRLYGPVVRHFAQPGVPDQSLASTWRPLASRLVAESLGWSGRPGPVHANLSFRDPLVGEPGPLPPGRAGDRPWQQVVPAGRTGRLAGPELEDLVDLVAPDGRARTGVIVAGPGTTRPPVVRALAQRLGWPVLADHRSGCRAGSHAVAHFDALLRSEPFAAAAEPEVVLRLGQPLASKILSQWLGSTGAHTVAVIDGASWIDPEQRAATVVSAPGAMESLLHALDPDLATAPSADLWLDADRRAAAAIASTLAGTGGSGGAGRGPSEVEVAQAVVAGLVTGAALVVSSSMPVRDVEWYGPNRDHVEVYANRGANGIDGVVATAIGVALSGRPATVLVGDVAFLHDSSSLAALRHRPVQLDIVVVDNDGGGIFSFLPQADLLPRHRFEQLFGTPHGTDLEALARAHGLDVVPWPLPPRQPNGQDQRTTGTRVCVVRTDRAANLDLHRRLTASVLTAISL